MTRNTQRASATSDGPSALARKSGQVARSHSVLPDAVTAAVYLAIAVVAYLPVWTHGWSQLTLGAGAGDPAQADWFLAWTPYALTHGASLLFSSRVNAPYGINLMWNTGEPVIGLLAWPVTYFVGPVAAFNVAMTVAPAAAAFSLYAVIVRLGLWRPSAVVGGYVFGFGPYMLGQGETHLNLVTTFVLPLIFYRLYRAVIGPARRPWRDGLMLGALLCMQFFISSELLTDAAVLTIIALLVYVGSDRRHIQDLLAAAPVFLVAALVVGVVIAYPVWFMLNGPQHLKGLVGLSIYSGNLLDVGVPTSNELLHATPWLAQANAGTLGMLDENGMYLGVPLLIVLAVCIVRLRSQREAALWALMSLVATVLALGPVLVVGARATGVALPMALIERLPLIGAAIPVRYSLFADFFAALATAALLTALWRARSRSLGRRAFRSVATAVVVVAPILPGIWPYGVGPAGVPPYFRPGGPSGGSGQRTVVAYPFPTFFHDQAMLWQANARMAFRLVGAYALTPPPPGAVISYQGPTSTLESALHAYYAGAAPLPMSSSHLRRERADLTRWGATTIVAAPLGVNPGGAKALLTTVVGHAPTWDQGVWVWNLSVRRSR